MHVAEGGGSALREGLAPEDGWNRRVEIVSAIPSGAAAASAIPVSLPVSASGDPAAPLRGVLCSWASVSMRHVALANCKGSAGRGEA